MANDFVDDLTIHLYANGRGDGGGPEKQDQQISIQVVGSTSLDLFQDVDKMKHIRTF
jgi:hypothetical protein